MNRRISALTGLLILLLPQMGIAIGVSPQSIFDTFYEQAKNERSKSDVSDDIAAFAVSALLLWNEQGIQLTPDEVKTAAKNNPADQEALCTNKKDKDGKPLELGVQGCNELQHAIVGLVNAERDADGLGIALTTIVNGAELAIADEPHRPVGMGSTALLMRRIWSGTGAAVLPWKKEWKPELDKLNEALNELSGSGQDLAVLRFHYGYYRDKREDDPRFREIAKKVGDALKKLSDVMNITGDTKLTGEFSTPNLNAPNIAFWARKDDLGLMWIYPLKNVTLGRTIAGTYPSFVKDGEKLAYPFDFKGSDPQGGNLIQTPLCSRTVGRFGYLCRTMPVPSGECAPEKSEDITLVKCPPKSGDDVTVNPGPRVCPDFKGIYLDDGKPLLDPKNPDKINPALKDADINKICDPAYKSLYQDAIANHACYIDFCLAQSMSGHTLVPGRNTTLIAEQTSPWLACIRPDPQLASAAEVMKKFSYALPQYLGIYLINDLERAYCGQAGDAPAALAGFCTQRSDIRAQTPDYNPFSNQQSAFTDIATVSELRNNLNAFASVIGERAALDQSLTIQNKIFGVLAQFVQQMSDFFLELKKAPLTKAMCPWTGPAKTKL